MLSMKSTSGCDEILIWDMQGMRITTGTGRRMENKTWLRMGAGMGMGMNDWEWEGMGLKKIFPLICTAYM